MDGLIQLAIIVVFVLISAAWQFMTENPQKKKKPRRPDERPIPPRPQAGGQPQAQRPQAGGLEAEIENFLRQVTGKSPRPKPPPQEPVVAEPVLAETVSEPQLVRRPPDRHGIGTESVAEHVQSHIATGGLDARDSHLASQIEIRDDEMDAHLHQVFDHEVGALKRESQSSVAATITRTAKSQQEVTADEILAFFQSPDDMRRAIIMKEILTPKSQEW